MTDNSQTQIANDPVLMSRFEIIKTLGEGAVGAVYLVRDHEFDNKRVALKTLINEIDLDENTYDRFKQEIMILQEIDHPNIIKAYDIIERADHIAYTMEYVDGSDLGSLYKKHNLNVEQIESITIQLLSALAALHNKGIWHRDIKLENVMLTADGTVKLADLGLVKNEFNKSYTKTGVLLGTAQYMPPEYVKEAKYDGRGDIYAAGVILFELLARKRRFPNLPGNKIVEELINCNFRIPAKELADLPPHLATVVNKAVEPSLKLRFQSAEQMIEAIENKDFAIDSPSKIEMKSTVEIGNLQKLQSSSKPESNIIWYILGSIVTIVIAVAILNL